MSSRRIETTNKANRTSGAGRWNSALRTPWTVACAVVTVLVGPAAATASALDRANAPPPHHAFETHPPYTTPYATLPQPLKRSHNLG